MNNGRGKRSPTPPRPSPSACRCKVGTSAWNFSSAPPSEFECENSFHILAFFVAAISGEHWLPNTGTARLAFTCLHALLSIGEGGAEQAQDGLN